MMRSRDIIIAIALLSASGWESSAQQKDTTLSSTTIEIIQQYKPEVKTTPKTILTPDLPPVSKEPAKQQYALPEFPLDATYHSQPLKPLVLRGDTTTKTPYQNYLKAGAGNLKTALFDLGIGGLRGENYHSTFRLHHLSQSGGTLRQQSFARSGIDASGELQTANKNWKLSFDAERNRRFYYGYDQKKDTLAKDSIRQTYVGIHVGAAMHTQPSPKGFQYGLESYVGWYSNAGHSKEIAFGIRVPVEKTLNENLAVLGELAVNILQYSHYRSVANHYGGAGAGLRYQSESFSAKALAQGAIGQFGKGYFLPQLQLQYHPSGTSFRVEGGVKSMVIQNSFEQLSTVNPFVQDTLSTLQGKETEYYIQAGTTLLKHLSFNASVGWHQYSNLPLYINSTLKPNEFTVVYDSAVRCVAIALGARYQFAERFSLGGTTSFYQYQNSRFAKVWHRPGMAFKADGRLRTFDKLFLTAYTQFITDIFAPDNSLPSGYIRLAGVADMGLGAEYEIVDRLGLFLNVNNLFNRQNVRWKGYDGYGIHINGGLRLRF